MSFRKFYLIPIWMLSLAVQPFLPSTHPWRFQVITLQWWADGATDKAIIFGWVMWTSGLSLLGLLIGFALR